MFITNDKEKNLKQRLRTLIERSEELKFLVGFFYFSGLRELYETLKSMDERGLLRNQHIKILVGLNVDKGNFGIYEYAKINKFINSDLIKKEFFESLKKALSSQELDREEVYEQAKFFVKLIEEGKLVIRKTREPNHAKLYLFKMNESVNQIIPSLFITGSSNLTKAGLESQNEFNVEIKDYGFEEAEKYFDSLWEKSIEIDKNDVVSVIKNETFLKEIRPFEAYYYLIKVYLETLKGEELTVNLLSEFMRSKGYKPYLYQIEAVAQAVKNCKEHNGTILADVVGLGKTVTACLVAKILGKRGLVICPPYLVGDENKRFGWKKYLEDFELWGWEVRSLGRLEEALKFVKEHKDIEVIIVDEAHRFRNEKTQSYHYLHEICRGKTVILLTATPFNNRPSDIFAMLKLFTIPKKSSIIFDENLEYRFWEYENTFKKLAYIRSYHNSSDKKRRDRARKYFYEVFQSKDIDISRVEELARKIAKEIRAILEPIVIRRNRLDLKYYGEKIDMPEVKDPQEWFFELTPEQLKFYDKVIESFKPIDEGGLFTGAIYFPIRYEKGLKGDEFSEELKLTEEESFLYTSQRNLYDFMRRLLVKRFESSFGAFRESVERFKRIHETALDFVKKTGKFILDRKLMEEVVTADPEEIDKKLAEYEEKLKEGEIDRRYHKVYEIEKFKDGKKFIKDIENDLKLFEDLLKEMDKVGLNEYDPKAERLIEGIENFLNERRKVVIFTEYLDTARYLKEKLEKKFGDKLLLAVGNLSKSTVDALYKNFDAQYKEQEDKYYILLTTDKLSEGFNLNRAGVVINYDIPWNPVRVIQRVGRINRIGKKVYDEIYIVNFFPTEKGADIVKSREIAQTKMFMIHNVLGEDAKIFAPDEEPTPSKLYQRLTTYKEDEEEESFFTKLRREFEEIKEKYPDIEDRVRDLPNRIKVAKRGEENELMVFIKRGKDIFVGYKNYNEKNPSVKTFEEVYEKIKATPEDKSLNLSDSFWKNYHQILDKGRYQRTSPKRSNETSVRAANLLSTLIDMDNVEKLKPYKKFISDLLEDIRSFGTLSEYALSEIVGWEEYLKNQRIDELVKEIEKLREQIGDDFIERIGKYIKEEDGEIIIAIENQKEGNHAGAS